MHRSWAWQAWCAGALLVTLAIITGAGFGATAEGPSKGDLLDFRQSLDRLLASKNWVGLADALSPDQPKEKFGVSTVWALAQVRAGRGGFFLTTFASRNLWLGGNLVQVEDPQSDPRVGAAAIALYAVIVISVDGTECADATSPTARFDQLIQQRGAVFQFLASRPEAVRDLAIRSAIKMDRDIGSKRPHHDEMLCNFGMTGMMAEVQSGQAHEVPNTTGHVGKTVDATPPPGWKPKFVQASVYEPAKAKVRATLQEQLETMVATIVKSKPARAELVDASRFQSYLDSPLHAGLVHRALAVMKKPVAPNCGDLGSRAVNTHPLTAITFGPDGVPNSGAWKSEIPITGCGDDTVVNLFFVVQPDGVKIKTVIGVRGWTRTHPDLQDTATNFAGRAAAASVPGCKQIDVINTKLSNTPLPEFPGKPTDPAYRPWSEIWTLATCGKKTDVLVSFFPSPNGTQIMSVGLDEEPPAKRP